MPKGSEHYAVWAQQILREARLGRVVSASGWKRKVFGRDAGREEDEKVEEKVPVVADEVDAGVKQARTAAQAGFVAKRWTLTSKAAEEPEVEYLAKRRKGLPSVHGAANGVPVAATVAVTSSVGVVAVAPGTMPVNSGTLIRIRVKRVDAQGLVKIYEVLRPEGHPIEGEIDQAVMTTEDSALIVEKPSAGTTIEGLGVAGDDGAIIASFSAIPTLSANAVPLPPRGPRRKQKGGFKKGRGKKVGIISERGGVSASAESLYALEAQAAQNNSAVPTTMDVDAGVDNTVVTVDGDEGSEEGEIEEDEGEGEGDGEAEVEAEGDEAEGDAMDDGDDDDVDDDGDGDGDGDREEGELTPDPADVDDMLPQSEVPPTSSIPHPLQPAPTSLYPQQRQSATSGGNIAGVSIEELATEPSLPVGVELTGPASPGETESSYAPPDLDLPFESRAVNDVELQTTDTPAKAPANRNDSNSELVEDLHATDPVLGQGRDVVMSYGDEAPEDEEDYEPPPVMTPLTSEPPVSQMEDDANTGTTAVDSSEPIPSEPSVAAVDPHVDSLLNPVTTTESLEQ